jgi:RNA polymerase sigma factor (sigma-70 family)
LGARTGVSLSRQGSVGVEATSGDDGSRPPASEAARKRVAVEMVARHEGALRRTARRYSLCADDADDAYQRALEILLTKAPTDDMRQLIRWMQTVTKHEALAVRNSRERLLGGPGTPTPESGEGEDWVALIPAQADGPAERAERREAIARSREALQALKPQELRALTLLAEGYSYAEIGEITGFSQTKINRCLAEGRERFRSLLSRSEDGRRCAEMGPLLSAFCDGEASPDEATAVREHLRACAGCRSALRTYRAAPRAAAALAPVLPVSRSLFERAHHALGSLSSRLPGGSDGSDSVVSQVAAAGGTRGAGVAALAKVLAICAGTAGGAAACVAAGVVPAPLDLGAEHSKPAIERSAEGARAQASAVEYETAPPAEPAPEPQPKPQKPQHESAPLPEPAPASQGAVEYTPEAAAPVAASSGGSSGSSSGSAAGEFGP